MLFTLFPLCFLGLVLIFYNNNLEKGKVFSRIRIAWLKSLLVFTSLIYISTEFLSFFNVLNTFSVALFWAIVVFVLAWVIFKNKLWPINLNLSALPLPPAYRKTLVVTILLGFLPLLFLAIYVSPNNIDSINYHLSRIISWTQNGNVKHFATWHIHQLYLNVLVEYIQMHIFILSGHNDYFVNLVQFVAMCSSVLTVGMIGKYFGLNYKSQLLVGLLLFTMPIGLLESTTTQVDYTACAFFLIFVYFSLTFTKTQKYEDALFMGLALVFGCFSKYSIFFFALPFCIWISVSTLLYAHFIKAIKTLSLILGIYLVVFSPLCHRNYQLFGNILSPPHSHILFQEDLSVSAHGLGLTVSNISKNIGLHLALPLNSYNLMVDKSMEQFHQFLGVDINDKATTHDKYHTQFIMTEDSAGNLVLLILIVIAGVVVAFRKNNTAEKLFLLSTITGFVLFCFALKYQHWSTRTHMPFFALGTVLVGIAFAKISEKVQLRTLWILLLLSIPYIYGNPNKPLFPVRYFSKYLLGYAPSFLCVSNPENVQKTQPQLTKFYDFGKPMPCFPSKKNLSYLERVQVVSALDELGYYEIDKTSVFQKSRSRQYFTRNLGGKQNYEDFMEIIKYIAPNTKGIAFKSPLGFYDYWAVARRELGVTIPFQYIGCHKEFEILQNEKRPFEYNYILTDDPNWLKNTIPTADIKQIINRPTITLVVLKNSSKNKYSF